MTIEEMKAAKSRHGLTYNILSDASGIPYGTVQKVFTGETAHPRYDTLRALEKAFYELGAADKGSLQYGQVSEVEHGIVRETARYVSKNQGEHTIEDYYALPDDVRMELIDGVFYDMGAPTTFHQRMAGEIYRQIANFIYASEGSCQPYISPIDVQLDCDDDTMVQPDVIIVCDTDKVKRRVVYGAPEFACEIISPSTKRKDYTIKNAKYMNAGVKEYWIVDPYKKYVLVYCYEDLDCPKIYPMEKSIPVNLYEGKLEIDFEQMKNWVILDD